MLRACARRTGPLSDGEEIDPHELIVTEDIRNRRHEVRESRCGWGAWHHGVNVAQQSHEGLVCRSLAGR